jgi:hypothetical protein
MSRTVEEHRVFGRKHRADGEGEKVNAVKHESRLAAAEPDPAFFMCSSMPSQASPFAKLKALMLEGRDRAHTLAYFKHRTRPNLISLIQYVALPEADALLARFQSCTRKRPCRAVTCSVCGEKLKARARDDTFNRIVERLGRFPHDIEVSYVTIDGPRTALDVEAARVALTRFERQLDNFIRRHARGTGWTGFMDVSTDGLVHLHALILHPDMPKSELEARLTRSFPGRKQVKVSPWDRSLSLAENLQNTFNYSVVAGRHVGVVTRRDGPDRNQVPAKAIDVVKRIFVVQSLAGRGVRGLRFVRNMKATHEGLKVVELETLQRRTKRVRKNSKTMLNQPWAPRGEHGTHLGLSKNPI